MDKVTRTDLGKRGAGKSLEADARGVLARLAQSPATVDDLGTDSFKLREGDDRDIMISVVRAELAKMVAGFARTIVRVVEVCEQPEQVRDPDGFEGIGAQSV